MFKIKLVFFLCIMYSGLLVCAPISEIQEINLSKAELAIIDHNYSLAYKLITQNLSRKHFHYNSYIFLANYYIEKGLWSKAFRVYYYLITKLHSKKVGKTKYTTDLPPYINDLPAPKPKALEVYFKIANLYYSLYSANIFTKEYSRSLLHHSKRFFYLCFYYKYNLPTVNYYLSLIELDLSHYNQAIRGFLRTKDLLGDIKNNENNEFIDSINQSLADTLIRKGNIDAGSLFLQNLYSKSSSSSSLKEYARNYMDSIQENYLLLTFSGTMTSNTNIGSLTSEELTQFDSETQISKGATSSTKNFNLFYSSKRFHYLSTSFSLNLTEEIHQNTDLYFRDYRNANIYIEGKYDNLIKSIIKFYYLYNSVSLKTSSDGKYETYAKTQTYTGEYIHALKSGTLSYQIPFTIQMLQGELSSTTKAQTTELGIKASYIPYAQYKYFSPTYTLFINSIEENDEEIANSFNLTSSFSNHFIFKQNFSTFLTLDYIINTNADVNYHYTQLVGSFTISYSFKFLQGFGSTINMNYSDKWINDDVVNIQKISLGFAYTF